ncbi:MAG: DUF5655 domain-containing protein [Bdellovibrionota bacterium]
MPAAPLVNSLFKGKKEKWKPLFPRLMARLSRISGVEIRPMKDFFNIVHSEPPRKAFGRIRATIKGIEIRLNLKKGTFRSERLIAAPGTKDLNKVYVLIREVSEIDEELTSWVKAAKSKARNARRKQT